MLNLLCVRLMPSSLDYGISSFATESGLNQDVGTAGYKAPELVKAKASKMPYDSIVHTSSTFYTDHTCTCIHVCKTTV